MNQQYAVLVEITGGDNIGRKGYARYKESTLLLSTRQPAPQFSRADAEAIKDFFVGEVECTVTIIPMDTALLAT